jgi:uncharacterized membrane protein
MKTAVKIMLLSLPVFLLAVYAVQAQDVETEAPPAAIAEPADDENRQAEMRDDDHFEKLLEKVRQHDPEEAARLEKLRDEDFRAFRREMRNVMRPQKPPIDRLESGRSRRGTEMESGTEGHIGMMSREKVRERMQAKENELLAWLEKNEPAKAKELTALKTSDPPAYMRRMAFEMRNYRQIIDAEQSNPALAEVLKQDVALKQKRNELLEKIKGTTNEKKKAELTKQLKEVVEQRFDLIVQKKQLRYEELQKRLEDLQQIVNKSQAELETLKSKKAEQTEKHLEELLSQSERIDWD